MAAAWGETPAPWRFGLDPYLSPRRIISIYAPLAEHLARRRLRVLLTTAPDYYRFLLRALGGEFDIVLAPPHVCRYLQVDLGYQPLFRIERDLSASLVVRTGTIKRLTDLRGHAVATPDHLSMATLLGLDTLRQAGLTPFQDVRIVESSGQLSALLGLRQGRVVAAFVSTGVLAALTPEAKQGLEVVLRTPGVPYLALMAHHRLPAGAVRRFVEAVQDFLLHSFAGQRFLLDTGYGGMSPPREADLKPLDRYLPQLRVELEELQPYPAWRKAHPA
ncbi:phosphate/phosphite/phosphonate ABC transporter substrate-binding protein [Chitinimonas lacunae]|uniref:Phosphate/phosphite/phosphonate ABC transporter substrate-binding protein n=1 Tax=Chitinimonas lacunae TaxID=1963018 RepID=A0ABV8MMP1_9NEIS